MLRASTSGCRNCRARLWRVSFRRRHQLEQVRATLLELLPNRSELNFPHTSHSRRRRRRWLPLGTRSDKEEPPRLMRPEKANSSHRQLILQSTRGLQDTKAKAKHPAAARGVVQGGVSLGCCPHSAEGLLRRPKPRRRGAPLMARLLHLRRQRYSHLIQHPSGKRRRPAGKIRSGTTRLRIGWRRALRSAPTIQLRLCRAK